MFSQGLVCWVSTLLICHILTKVMNFGYVVESAYKKNWCFRRVQNLMVNTHYKQPSSN